MIRKRKGQAALEYILVFCALLVAVYAAYRFMDAPASVTEYHTDVICSEHL